MKKYGILVLVLVLTATVLAGCRNPDIKPTELPPTQGATMAPTTAPTTMPTTVPTTIPETDAGSASDATGDMSGENGSSGATTATEGNASRGTQTGRAVRRGGIEPMRAPETAVHHGADENGDRKPFRPGYGADQPSASDGKRGPLGGTGV